MRETRGSEGRRWAWRRWPLGDIFFNLEDQRFVSGVGLGLSDWDNLVDGLWVSWFLVKMSFQF